MTRGMRRIVDVVAGFATLTCGHLVPSGQHAWAQVGRAYLFCCVCGGRK